MMLQKVSQKNFENFRNRLIKYSSKFKIQFEDLEEIVNDAILKAWKHFDNDRGSFESLCLVIIKRKIFNFTRDHAHLYFLILLDEIEDIVSTDDTSLESKEQNQMALIYLLELRSRLNEVELKLFDEIYSMCEGSAKFSLSKASRNIGLEPAKGWDLFRKIQRKAKRDVTYRMTDKHPRIVRDEELYDAADSLFIEDQVLYSPSLILREEQNKTEQLLSRFSKEDLEKLNSIYNF